MISELTNRALAQRQPLVFQVGIDGLLDVCRQLGLLQQLPEIRDRRVLGIGLSRRRRKLRFVHLQP